MLVPGQENASQELRTCGPPRLGITFPNQFSHGINETEMWLDLQDIRQDGNIADVERFYSIRIFEDGFTEIKYESNDLKRVCLPRRNVGVCDSQSERRRHDRGHIARNPLQNP